MLNRHSLRVKTMQQLYAYFQDGAANNKKFQIELNNSINDVYNAYIYVLYTLKEIVNYSIKDSEIRKKKFIPTHEDLNISTKISSTPIIKSLFSSSSFVSYCKENIKTIKSWEQDEETIQSEYYKLLKTPEYKRYITSTDTSTDDDREIVLVITKSLLKDSVLFDNYISKFYINWTYDKAVVSELVFKTLKSKVPELRNLVRYPENINFAINLFKLAANSYTHFDEIIKSKTINWDFNRILLLDKILIRMAIAEFINFESIPHVSTIDEYLTISKQFSSSKSYIFINGILDAILKDIDKLKIKLAN